MLSTIARNSSNIHLSSFINNGPEQGAGEGNLLALESRKEDATASGIGMSYVDEIRYAPSLDDVKLPLIHWTSGPYKAVTNDWDGYSSSPLNDNAFLVYRRIDPNPQEEGSDEIILENEVTDIEVVAYYRHDRYSPTFEVARRNVSVVAIDVSGCKTPCDEDEICINGVCKKVPPFDLEWSINGGKKWCPYDLDHLVKKEMWMNCPSEKEMSFHIITKNYNGVPVDICPSLRAIGHSTSDLHAELIVSLYGRLPVTIDIDWGDETEPLRWVMEYSLTKLFYHTYDVPGMYEVKILVTRGECKEEFEEIIEVP